MARAKATKRRRLTSARATPSGFNLPVDEMPRPRPHITFSLKSGNTAAPSRSKTTRRSEFEPRSMTPTRSAAANGSRSAIRSAHDEPVEIAWHPIGRTDEHLGPMGGQLVAVAEAHDAAMFEKPPDDALHANIFGEAGNARPQTADPAHHQIDAHPSL